MNLLPKHSNMDIIIVNQQTILKNYIEQIKV